MGPKQNKGADYSSKNKLIAFEKNEHENVVKFYEKYYDNERKEFQFENFSIYVFKNLNNKIKTNLINFLNDYYRIKKIDKFVNLPSNLSCEDILFIAHILIKSNFDTEDDIYFRKNTLLILYDISMGKVEAFKNKIMISDIIDIFNFATLIYLEKYQANESLFTAENNKVVQEYLKNNILILKDSSNSDSIEENPAVDLNSLIEFIDTTLFSFDGFLKNYLRKKFFMNENEISLLTSLPIFTETPSVLPVFKFFYFCLATPLIFSKSYAFKLYDCKKNGYNISNLIYSFIGFPGPVAILIQHYEEDGSEVILGVYLNSNFKECYEKFCGDDLSFIFTISPKLHFYKCLGGNSERICFISSKTQKFSKVQPGIGLGWSNGNSRLWIDSTEPFKKSHFGKYDDVFEEGTPFKSAIQYLNVIILFLI
jgi:hypothetical protein